MCEISEKWWQEGRKEGRKEGRQEGLQKGEESKAHQTSVNLFRMGMPVERIAEAVQMNVTLVRQWVSEAAVQGCMN